MTEQDLRTLLTRGEGETLDFKVEAYDLTKSRNAFVKDLLSMANTPRDAAAHIVLGVRWTPEDGSTVQGLSTQLDDVVFQSALGSDRVQPRPRFTYTPIQIDGKAVGVIEIPPSQDGPYASLKDYEGLQAGAIYYRRGSQNDRAVGSELQRVLGWFFDTKSVSADAQDSGAWNRFLLAVRGFEPNTTYLLAIDKLPMGATGPLYALGNPPWRAVFDFDPDSESTGVLSQVAGSLGHHRVIHRVVRGTHDIQPSPGTHWLFARGMAGRQETLALGDHRAWLKLYKREIGLQLEELAKAVNPTPVLAVILWSDPSLKAHLRTLTEELHGAFGEAIEIVVASSDSASFSAFVDEELGATFVGLNVRAIASGISVLYADRENPADDRYVLTNAAGAPVEVVHQDWLWMSEDLDIIHRSSGMQGRDDPNPFRRGYSIDWRDLHLRHDCDRDITARLVSQLEDDLRRRQTVRVNLYHAPGAGGTTVGRRVAWDLRASYPAAVLKKCSPRITADRIAKLAALTESTVLVIVDGGDHSERDIDDLYEFLKAGQTPVVILQVLRRFQQQQEGKRQAWLPAQLSDVEADRFRIAYGQAMPSKVGELIALSKLKGPQRNAFFFGLTAFEVDFKGLSPYVQIRLKGLGHEQKRILVYIALAHYYGQQSIPAQAFAGVLGVPRSRAINLVEAFAGNAADALGLLVHSAGDDWRTAHPLIALEVLQQLLAPTETQIREVEKVWKQSLSSWAKAFATFCRGDEPNISEQLLELARRVFIYRDNVEVLGTERAGSKGYSQLIEDVPSVPGKAELLRHLTDCFPQEAHLHAHLGRFLSLNGEYVEGLAAIDFAISIQPDDSVLHHMRGMAIRQTIASDDARGIPIHQLVEDAEKASESFQNARRLAPDIEHGYVSEVQLLIDMLDRAGRAAKGTVRQVISQSATPPYLRNALERAEDLLDQVQHLFAGEKPSRYVVDCRARIQRMYGDYQTALQSWDNLLGRPEVAKPPVRRQIVWTLLHRQGNEWGKLSKKDVRRITTLLEENLEEERNDSTSLRLWLRVIRFSESPPSLDAMVEKIGYWKVNTGALDAAFYLYVTHTLRAFSGSSQGLADAQQALEECRSIARFRRDRTRSFEWIGDGLGISALVHQSQLGEWSGDFWEDPRALTRLQGRVSSIDGPQKGMIELDGGVQAFFVPGRTGFHAGRDENSLITCFVGFSYDGPRAWDVSLESSPS